MKYGIPNLNTNLHLFVFEPLLKREKNNLINQKIVVFVFSLLYIMKHRDACSC